MLKYKTKHESIRIISWNWTIPAEILIRSLFINKFLLYWDFADEKTANKNNFLKLDHPSRNSYSQSSFSKLLLYWDIVHEKTTNKKFFLKTGPSQQKFLFAVFSWANFYFAEILLMKRLRIRIISQTWTNPAEIVIRSLFLSKISLYWDFDD